jgi:hypothetical protein
MMIQSALLRALCGATLATALISAPAFAGGDKEKHDQHGAAQAKPASVQGTVKAVSPSSLTLEKNDGTAVKVELDKETTYENAGKTGAVSELRAGMIVSIRGEQQKDGTVRADSVRYGSAQSG